MNGLKNRLWSFFDGAIRKLTPSFLDCLRQITPISIKRILSRFLMKNRDIDGDIIISSLGHKFVSISEPVFLHVVYDGIYEKEITRVVSSIVKSNDTVVDIGSNFGWYSVLFADLVGPSGKVFAFEPNASIFQVLKKNISLNDFTSIIRFSRTAVGDTIGDGYLHANDHESGAGYINCDNDLGEVSRVTISSLDRLLHDYINQIAFMKIDVEGFEPKVLSGAQKILNSDNPPIILVEFNLEALQRAGENIDAFITKLSDYGIAYIIKSSRLVGIDTIPKKNSNLFIFPKRGIYSNRIITLDL